MLESVAKSGTLKVPKLGPIGWLVLTAPFDRAVELGMSQEDIAEWFAQELEYPDSTETDHGTY